MSRLPSNVLMVPFKRFAEPVLGKMLQPQKRSDADKLVPYLKAGHVQWAGIVAPEELPQMWAAAREVEALHPNEGDLLICEGGEVGRATLVSEALAPQTIIQNSLHLVRGGPKACPRYLKYALEYVTSIGWVDLICNKATIAHLTVEKLRELPVPYCAREEQQRIANFLDEQTARIEVLIAGKERLALVVSELRQSVISDTVTVRSTPGWHQTRLKFLVTDIIDTEHKTVPFQDDGDYLVARTSNIKKGRLVFNDAKYTDLAGFQEWTRRAVPAPGDILFTREAPAGEACLVPEGVPLCLGQRTVLIRVDANKVNSSFVLWSIYGGLADRFISDLSQGSTVAHFNMPDIGNIPLFTGPLEQQNKKVLELEAKLNQFDGLSLHVDQHIARLREYRSSLVLAAVTGQIDINNFQLEAA